MTEHSVVTRIKLDGNEASSSLSKLASQSSKLDSALSKAQGSASSLKSGLMLGAVAGVAGAAITKIANSIKVMSAEAMDASDALDGYNYAMGFIGVDKNKIDSSKQVLKDYALSTTYNLRDVMKTAQVVASSGEKDFDVITKSLGNVVAMGDGAGVEFQRVSDGLSKINSKGKLQAEAWESFSTSIPAAANLLKNKLKETGAYTGDFADAMSKGKITAKEFNQALVDLGDNEFAENYAKGTSFYSGSTNRLKNSVISAWVEIESSIGKGNIISTINQIADGMLSAGKSITGVISYVKQNGDWLAPMTKGIVGALLFRDIMAKSTTGVQKLQTALSSRSINTTTTAYAKATVAQKAFMQGGSPAKIVAQHSAIQSSLAKTNLAYAKNAQVAQKKSSFNTMSLSKAGNYNALAKNTNQVTTSMTKMQKASSIAQTGVRGLGSAVSFLAGPYGLLLGLGGMLAYSFYKQSRALSETSKMYVSTTASMKDIGSGLKETNLGKISTGITKDMTSMREEVNKQMALLNVGESSKTVFNSMSKAVMEGTNKAKDYIKNYGTEMRSVIARVNKDSDADSDYKNAFSVIGKNFDKQAAEDMVKLNKVYSKLGELQQKASNEKEGSKKYNSYISQIVAEEQKVQAVKEKYTQLSRDKQLNRIKAEAESGKLSSESIKEANKLISDSHKKGIEQAKNNAADEIAVINNDNSKTGKEKYDLRKKAVNKGNEAINKATRDGIKNVVDINKEGAKELGKAEIEYDANTGKFGRVMRDSAGKKNEILGKFAGEQKEVMDKIDEMVKQGADPKEVQKYMEDLFGATGKAGDKTKDKNDKTVKDQKKNAAEIKGIIDQLTGSKVDNLSIDGEKIKMHGQDVTKMFQQGMEDGIQPEAMAQKINTAVKAGFTVDNEGIKLGAQNVTGYYNAGLVEGLKPEQIKAKVKEVTQAGFSITGENITFNGANVSKFYEDGIKNNLSPEQIHQRVQAVTDAGFDVSDQGAIISAKGGNLTKYFEQGIKNGGNPAGVAAQMQAMVNAGFTVDGTQVMLGAQNVTKDFETGIKAGLSPEQIKASIEEKIPDAVDKNVKADVKTDVKTENKKGETEEKLKKDLPDSVNKNVKVSVKPTVTVASTGNVRAQIISKIPSTISKSVRVNISASSNASSAGARISSQLVSGINSKAGAATGAGRGLANKAVAGARSGASGGSSIGAFFGSGFVGGVSSMVNAAYSAGVALGNAAKAGTKAAGDVKSPSKEMGKLGRFYVQGFNININQGISTLNKTGYRLGKAVINGTKKAISKATEVGIISDNYQKMLGQAMSRALTKAKSKAEKEKIIKYYADLINTEKRERSYAVKQALIEQRRDSAVAKQESKISKLEKQKSAKNVKKNKKKLADINRQITKAKNEIKRLNSNANIQIGKVENEKKLYDLRKELNEKLADEEKSAQEAIAEKKAKDMEKALEKRGLISPTLSSGDAKIINITQPIQIYNQFQEVRNMDQLIRHMDTSMRSMFDQMMKNIR